MNPNLSSLFKRANLCLNSQQKSLVEDTATLVDKLNGSHINGSHINDYSFMVSPIAKAYEGYLKDFFLKIGIIDQYSYESDRFRVGKTLNPSLRYKRFSVYQKLIDMHNQGEELAEILWQAWKYGRNQIFHYFPSKLENLSKQEAEDRISQLLEAIIKSQEFIGEIDR